MAEGEAERRRAGRGGGDRRARTAVLVSSASVSRRLETRSETTSALPSGEADTWAAPAAPGSRSRLAIWCSSPPAASKTVTFGVPPEFSTYTRPCCSSMLAGATPPEGTLPIIRRPSRTTRNAVTLLDPALTA